MPICLLIRIFICLAVHKTVRWPLGLLLSYFPLSGSGNQANRWKINHTFLAFWKCTRLSLCDRQYYNFQQPSAFKFLRWHLPTPLFLVILRTIYLTYAVCGLGLPPVDTLGLNKPPVLSKLYVPRGYRSRKLIRTSQAMQVPAKHVNTPLWIFESIKYLDSNNQGLTADSLSC